MSVDPPIIPNPDDQIPPVEPATEPEPDPSDPAAFFRRYYTQRGGPPKGSTKPEIEAYRKEFTAKTTKSDDELKDIAKMVRAEMRMKAKPAGDDDEGSDPSTVSSSVGLLGTRSRKIAFGAFISVAVAILSTAAYYLKQNRTWEEMRPFAIGIIALAGILLLLSFSVAVLKDARVGGWFKRSYAIFAVILSGIVILVVAGWFCTHVARDAGWMGPIEKPLPARVIVNPPGTIGFTEANSYENNTTLKDEIFGSLQDDRGRPREWMRDLEYGAQVWLNNTDVVYSWLLATERSNASFTAHVYVGTPDDIVLLGFFLEPREFGNDVYKVTMLPLKFKPDRNNKELYKLVVPESKEPGQLLVFIAMTSATAKKWQHGRKRFSIQKEMN